MVSGSRTAARFVETETGTLALVLKLSSVGNSADFRLDIIGESLSGTCVNRSE